MQLHIFFVFTGQIVHQRMMNFCWDKEKRRTVTRKPPIGKTYTTLRDDQERKGKVCVILNHVLLKYSTVSSYFQDWSSLLYTHYLELLMQQKLRQTTIYHLRLTFRYVIMSPLMYFYGVFGILIIFWVQKEGIRVRLALHHKGATQHPGVQPSTLALAPQGC